MLIVSLLDHGPIGRALRSCKLAHRRHATGRRLPIATLALALLCAPPCLAHAGLTVWRDNKGPQGFFVVLGAGDAWLFDADTWVSRYGAGLTLDSADTAGTDGMPVTEWSSASVMLTLTPTRAAGARKVMVRLNGTGRDGTTSLKVRARRKYR